MSSDNQKIKQTYEIEIARQAAENQELKRKLKEMMNQKKTC
jgi:hypothetical protein